MCITNEESVRLMHKIVQGGQSLLTQGESNASYDTEKTDLSEMQPAGLDYKFGKGGAEEVLGIYHSMSEQRSSIVVPSHMMTAQSLYLQQNQLPLRRIVAWFIFAIDMHWKTHVTISKYGRSSLVASELARQFF